MKITASEISKFIAALVGAAGEAVTAGLVTGNTAKWVELGIGVVTALAVWLVPNTTAALKPAPAVAPPPAPPVTGPPGA